MRDVLDVEPLFGSWQPALRAAAETPGRAAGSQLNTLVQFEPEPDAFVADSPRGACSTGETGASGQERGFATELASGCVRRMITLDLHRLSRASSWPRENIEDSLWIHYCG